MLLSTQQVYGILVNLHALFNDYAQIHSLIIYLELMIPNIAHMYDTDSTDCASLLTQRTFCIFNMASNSEKSVNFQLYEHIYVDVKIGIILIFFSVLFYIISIHFYQHYWLYIACALLP